MLSEVNKAEHLYQRMAKSRQWLHDLAKDTVYRPASVSRVISDIGSIADDMRGHLGMASKKARKKATWKSFANVDIPAHRREEAKDVIAEVDLTIDRIGDLVAQGYKLSVSYSPDTDTYIATLTGTYADLKNAGLSMSGYGKDWVIALGVVAYKHFHIAEENWTSVSRTTSEDFG